ncbi:hypothetical protein BCR39DRAFT_550013 [Naematelia encephala]|uniref:Methyltransferase-domain-containing protein n=1 Tax=Naematelia encephala TaxID=71784 RepID=A0A1Y2AKS0_9TREE|nr:hypothetical protein BCR39DRAFT_550013 [Naematelia encephala]
MEIYMSLASRLETDEPAASGLGFLDPTKPVLEIEFDLTLQKVEVANIKISGRSRKGAGGRSHKELQDQGPIIFVKLQQDLGALKSRKGDTGSVLWRSSYHLARNLLASHHHPPGAPLLPLLDLSKLRQARILELGAGTGLLAILLSPLCKEYTVSDRIENLRLVERNLELNGINPVSSARKSEHLHPTTSAGKAGHMYPASSASKAAKDRHERNRGESERKYQDGLVRLEEVDWTEVSRERQRHRSRHDQNNTGPYNPTSSEKDTYDLVLAVDCIYNENLVQPFVDTLAFYCPKGGRTVVWVVVELRSADVLTLFLETWLADSEGQWTIVRIFGEALGDWGSQKPRWVGWVGWR